MNLQTNKPKYFKWLLIGGVVASAIAILYFQFRDKKKRNPPTKFRTDITDRLETNRSIYSQYYFDEDEVLKQILLQISENPTIQEIFMYSPSLIRDEFVKYTKQMRKRRRLIRKHNQQMYITIVMNYYAEVEQLLEKSRFTLSDNLGINEDKLEQMINQYDAQQDIRSLQQKAQGVLMKQLSSSSKKRQLSKENLLKILSEQINFIKTKMYQRLLDKLQQENFSQENQLRAINALLDDIIYEKFGYEREHIEEKISELGIDCTERHQCRMILQADIGNIKMDSSMSEHSETAGHNKIINSLSSAADEQSVQIGRSLLGQNIETC